MYSKRNASTEAKMSHSLENREYICSDKITIGAKSKKKKITIGADETNSRGTFSTAFNVNSSKIEILEVSYMTQLHI